MMRARARAAQGEGHRHRTDRRAPSRCWPTQGYDAVARCRGRSVAPSSAWSRTRLSEKLLCKEFRAGETVFVDAAGDEIVFEHGPHDRAAGRAAGGARQLARIGSSERGRRLDVARRRTSARIQRVCAQPDRVAARHRHARHLRRGDVDDVGGGSVPVELGEREVLLGDEVSPACARAEGGDLPLRFVPSASTRPHLGGVEAVGVVGHAWPVMNAIWRRLADHPFRRRWLGTPRSRLPAKKRGLYANIDASARRRTSNPWLMDSRHGVV